jgi:hypothetical protein
MTQTFDWDRPAVLRNKVTDTQLPVYEHGKPRTIGVPPGDTARSFAGVIHGFDGVTVVGFGYGPDDEHPDDCQYCVSGTPEWHNYERPMEKPPVGSLAARLAAQQTRKEAPSAPWLA